MGKRSTEAKTIVDQLDLEVPDPIKKAAPYDYRIPEHPRYRSGSDGHIVGFDPNRPHEHESRMAQFWDPIEQRMKVVIYCRKRLTREEIPLAFDAAELIARGFGAPLGYAPGFRDGNPMNLRRVNLIMPEDLQKAPVASGEGAGSICVSQP